MIRIYKDAEVPKYRAGKWLWNGDEEQINFEALNTEFIVKDEYQMTGGYKFISMINQVEEGIFRREYQRSEESDDSDVIVVRDLINLVLFLSPPEFMNKDFIYFISTRLVDRLIRALIIYFEYFLKMVEFLLIRRDEISGDMAQIQSSESMEMKRVYSAHLTQYRILIAREYSTILLGTDEAKPFYHIKPIVNISQSFKDKHFHERFQAFVTQVVWIAMHRRAYDTIDAEICRLFRSEHFKLTQEESIKFQKVEASMLFGRNYRRVNYRAQTSPLIQELTNVAPHNMPILWIGKRKYRGTDMRIAQIELEFLVPDSQLNLIDVSHGILGHPKKVYDTMLNLCWNAVRDQKYSENYDPYFIVRQPSLKIPKLDEEKLRMHAKAFESYYQIKTRFEPMTKAMKEKWMHREELLALQRRTFTHSVMAKCQQELENPNYGPSVQEIMRKFLETKRKKRKK